MTEITRAEFLKRATVSLMAPAAASLAVSASGATAATKPDGKKKYTMVVLTNAKAGREVDFNEWYSNRHVHDVVKIPGFVAAQRFQWAETPGATAPKFKYYASYELDTDDLGTAVAELFKRNGTPLLPSSDAMDPDVYFAVYEAITPVVEATRARGPRSPKE
jgi:hypothetical protein